MNPADPSSQEDLTDAEVATAVSVQSSLEVLTRVKKTTCPTCGTPTFTWSRHAFRKQGDRRYWQLTRLCESNHTLTLLFRASWLDP